mmetsp:Transcript_17219/g.54788  ORF Transcript_17219/g.54788 Transcript_17219/m.54788 type:complete len:202 (+) Transcript_17219:867-1472(+)
MMTLVRSSGTGKVHSWRSRPKPRGAAGADADGLVAACGACALRAGEPDLVDSLSPSLLLLLLLLVVLGVGVVACAVGLRERGVVVGHPLAAEGVNAGEDGVDLASRGAHLVRGATKHHRAHRVARDALLHLNAAPRVALQHRDRGALAAQHAPDAIVRDLHGVHYARAAAAAAVAAHPGVRVVVAASPCLLLLLRLLATVR